MRAGACAASPPYVGAYNPSRASFLNSADKTVLVTLPSARVNAPDAARREQGRDGLLAGQLGRRTLGQQG